MEAKPLTKAQRKLYETTAPFIGLAEVLAAEQYWREVVKRTDAFAGGEPCVFCGCVKGTEVEHKPDCAWLLSQGENGPPL